MTNDDKDLKLKECPFCSGLVKSHIEPTGKLIFICLICEVQWTKCGDISTFNALNARPTPQKPSEPLKELDEDKLAMEISTALRDYNVTEGSISLRPLKKCSVPIYEYIAKAICTKFGQPSEKKALSVDDIDRIIEDHDKWTDEKSGYELVFLLAPARRIIAQAIHSALPAQREVRYPENRKEK